MTFRKLVLFSIIAAPLSAVAKVPTAILESPGQPQVAVFSAEKQGFAIGCQAIRSVWEAVPVRKLSAAEWNAELSSLSIADLHCDERTRKYRVFGPPAPHDAIVITRRDGSTERHYVDDDAWLKGIKGPITGVTEQQLVEIAPNRGVDFHANRKPHAPTPTPSPSPSPVAGNQPPTFSSYWSGSYFYIDAKNPSSKTRSCNYSFTFSYDDFGQRKERTENGAFSLNPGFSGNAVKFAGAWVNPRKKGEPSIQCN